MVVGLAVAAEGGPAASVRRKCTLEVTAKNHEMAAFST
jgi:hypothetical protein